MVKVIWSFSIPKTWSFAHYNKIYFIIVAVLTASVFDFDQMTNDQMTSLLFVFRLYFPRKSWMDFSLTLPWIECLLCTLILIPGRSWIILSFPDLVDSLLLFSWCSWQSISWISWQFTRNVDTFTEKVVVKSPYNMQKWKFV